MKNVNFKNSMKQVIVTLLLTALSYSGYSQVSWGPYIDVARSGLDNRDTGLTMRSNINPSFGLVIQKDFDYLFSLRGTVGYSYKTIQGSSVTDSKKTSKLTGQYIDMIISGRFSNFDDEKKILPYVNVGVGNSMKVFSRQKGDDSLFPAKRLQSNLPLITLGAGTGIKTDLFSQIDISVNYNRYLSSMHKDRDFHMNQFSLRLLFLLN